jgi:hypothetical protein
MRWTVAGAILFVCLSPVLAATADRPETLENTLKRGFKLYQTQQCPEAVAILKDAVEAPSFSQVKADQQYSALLALAACYYNTRDYAASSRIAQVLTENPFATTHDWEMRFYVGFASQDFASSAIALTYLAQHHPETLSSLPPQNVSLLVEAEKKTPEGRARNDALLNSLFAAKWRPVDQPPLVVDTLWLPLVRSDIEAGRLDHARLVAASINAPIAREAMWADKAFDPITGGDPAHFGIEAYYTAEVARERAEMVAHPDLLSYVVPLAQLLSQLDSQDEALALLDDTIAKMKVEDRFRDMRMANWIEDARAEVLNTMGDGEAWRAHLEAAVQENEKQVHGNASQTINLAGFYCSQGLPKDALKLLKRVTSDNTSPYGVMAAEEVRACAYTLQNDTAGLAQSVAFAKAHSTDAPLLAIRVMLYANDIEAAATLALGFLADPDRRWQVLTRLHHHKASRYRPANALSESPGLSWSALRDRADIRAAADKFGRILDLPTVHSGF